MTTAPTAAEADAVADLLGMASSLFSIAVNQLTTVRLFLAAYTQNDATVAGIQLLGDPTADMASATTCRGLVADYASILVREYTCGAAFPASVTDDPAGLITPSGSFAADS